MEGAMFGCLLEWHERSVPLWYASIGNWFCCTTYWN